MEGILSQEEIDALLGGGDSSEEVSEPTYAESSIVLTKEEIDAIGELGNISLGSSSTALSTLLMKEVSITAPTVRTMTFEQLKGKSDQGEKVLIRIEYTSGFAGINLLIIEKKDAIIIGDLMMGNDGTNPPEELDDLYQSAVGEAMNQMMGTASTALAGMFGKEIDINPPEIKIAPIDNFKDGLEFFKNNPEFIVVEFQLEVADLISTKMYQIMTESFAKELTQEMYAMMGGIEEEVAPIQQEMPQQQMPQQQQQMQQPMQQQQMQQQPMMQQPMMQQMPPQMMGGYGNYGQAVNVQPAQFAAFGEQSMAGLPQNIDLIMDVPLEVTVELGRTKMLIKEILDLGAGSIVELDKLAGEPVDVLVNGKLIAKGEVVVIDESFGVRITDIISKMERLNKVQ